MGNETELSKRAVNALNDLKEAGGVAPLWVMQSYSGIGLSGEFCDVVAELASKGLLEVEGATARIPAI